MDNPIVSVLVTTYNHGNYISECIESILNQRIDFSMEIVIGVDLGNDNTSDIVQEYENNYPDIIRTIIFDSKVGPIINGLEGIKSCTGKYLSICDGDDFWTDPNKLQKQIDFLEQHKDYGIVYSDIDIIIEKGYKNNDNERFHKNKEHYKSGYIFWDLMKYCFINTNTVMIKKRIIDEPLRKDRFNITTHWFIYDYWFWLNISQVYKVKYFDEKMATYRVHSSSISDDKNFFKKRSLYVKLDIISNLRNTVIKTQQDQNIIGGILLGMLIKKNVDFNSRLTIVKLLFKYNPSIKYIFSKFRIKYLYNIYI